MIRQYLWKKRKILSGFLRTYIRKSGEPYDPAPWFDKFYETGVSDRQTIANEKDTVSSRYHYASVELLITRHFVNHQISLKGSSVFDIGSGAGHWLDFYKGIGAERCAGIDVSEGPVSHLREKYRDDNTVQINKGLFQDYLDSSKEKYDIINAIGVIFHVVNDSEWRRGLAAIAKSLSDGGQLVVGGHFGFLNNVNVQFDAENKVNKRLRSRASWTKELKKLGFRNFNFCYNNSYLFIRDTLPENNILIATK